ncbi:3'-5' exoribonuclease HELZ2-like isoform X1 [Danio rerio]|uniref:3'-5' exoribonuclease HELZ2-like isoform X1 n=2 Tax=Danio rerio TaxID=7955 RepID=A0AC58G353_DANRE
MEPLEFEVNGSEPEFDQELSKKDIEELLTTRPNVFKRCKLETERHDQAYARPLDEPTLTIKIFGRENMGRSLPGDEVCVEILNTEECLCEGRVVGLINRDEDSLVFVCKMVEDNPKCVTAVNKCMTRIRTVQGKPGMGLVEVRQLKYGRWVTKEFAEIAENNMLVVKIIKWESTKPHPLGVVTKVIPACDAFHEILDIELGSKGKPPPFQQQKDKEGVEREDLSDIFTFTIDSTSTQDLDDAISVTEMDDSYQIGIHITDVASYIIKNSEQDEFARMLGRTIYTPEKGDVAFMFSREISKEYLSLIDGEERRALSLLVVVDKKTSQIRSTQFALTLINSDRRMSYKEADQIIQKYFSETEPLRFSRLEDCVAVAYRFSEAHRKSRLEGGWQCGRQVEQTRSQAMVEELMTLYNSAAAEELISADVTKDLTPLRCHQGPDPNLLIQFKEKYTDLIPMSAYFSNMFDENMEYNPEHDGFEHSGMPFTIFTSILHKMEEFAQSRDYYSLTQLIFSDEIHPTLVPMVRDFREIKRKAVILRSCTSKESRLGHYDLQMNAYTWASSPMRRYLDLIVQRLLHTMLSKQYLKQADYTNDEINRYCLSGMEAEEEQDALVFRLRKIQFEPRDVVNLATVDQITPKGHEFIISFPLQPSLDLITIMYKHLKVVDQPKYNEDKNSMTLHWKRRVYTFGEVFKNRFPSNPMKNVTPVSSILWKRLISAVKHQDWAKIEQCFQNIKREEKPEMEKLISEASSTQENSKMHYKELNLELKLGDVVQVQLGSEFKDGLPVPVVQLLSVNECFEICLEHSRNPTLCFSDSVCIASKISYESYEEYQKIWTQLCQIDTAYNALEENNSVILEEVFINWSDEINLQGFFHLTKTQKTQWSLEFDLTNCFLCIRLRRQKLDENLGKHIDRSAVSDLQGCLPFTWVAHAVTTKSKKKDANTKGRINFKITHRSMTYIPARIFNKGTKFTIEVIPKKIPYLLREQAVANLKRANNLVKSVATGKLELNDDADLRNISLYDVDKSLNLPTLNMSQKKAVKEAMKKPFTVIQGPPGTGKTVVGIHIVFQFFKKNKDFMTSFKPNHTNPDGNPPKKPAILYCGPSNKSVDIVAEQLLKLSGVLKPLRIYCDQMEMREFPYTGSELKLCRRSLRDEKPKEELRDITLMYLVRKPENPFSEEIKALEKNLSVDQIDNRMNRQLIQHVFTQQMPFQPQPISGKQPYTPVHTHTLQTI